MTEKLSKKTKPNRTAASSFFCILLTVLSMLLLCACGAKAKAPEGTVTRMTIDVNPSVEFMIDDENKVVSATALNDDGSILIAGEAFVSMTAEEATEAFVKLSCDTGYLVQGNVSADENTVSISVSGNTDYAKQLAKDLEEKAADVLKKADIEGKVEAAEALKLEQLRTLAEETGLFTGDEIAVMTEEELYKAIAAGRMETAQLLTEEMREVYYAEKEHRISFAEREETAKVIEGMGGLYMLIYSGYKTALDTYGYAVDALDEFRYDMLVSPESEYQKNLEALRAAKTELLQQKNYVATLDVNGEEYASAQVTLRGKEETYNQILALYEGIGDAINTSMEHLIAELRSCEQLLVSIEERFSDDIKAELTAKAVEIETALNASKDRFFTEFEAAHKEDIEAAEASLIAQKQAMIDAAKAQ